MLESSGNEDIQLELQEHKQLFHAVLPRYLRYSFIALLWMVVETEGKRLCGKFATRTPAPATHLCREKTADDLLQTLKKLSELSGGEKTRASASWDALHDLSKIRNCIVHARSLSKNCLLTRMVRCVRP